MLYLIVLFLAVFNTVFAEKLYVVERERGALAVIEDGKFIGEIKDLGNLNHSIVKTKGDFSYCIARNGYFSKINNKTDRLIKKIKPGNSGIGFTFVKNYIAIAHYDPKKITVLDLNLNTIREIKTGSRNVGIKPYGNLLVFSLMDKDQIWVLDADKQFKKIFTVENAGKMPFDALINGDRYIVGFFKERGVGILDLTHMRYRKVKFKSGKEEVVFKIPHFGMWGVFGDKAVIPAVGEKKAYVVSVKSMEVIKQIPLKGLPVFIVVSPDRKTAVVNYSGKNDNLLSVINLKSLKLTKTFPAGKRVMHMRFSKDGKKLYVSSYFDNSLKVFNTENWKLINEITIPNPSGIFIVR